MIYELSKSLFTQAEMYRHTVLSLTSNDVYNPATTVLNELAMECYLGSLIEHLSGKSLESIYGKGCIPHDLFQLYNAIYSFDKEKQLPIFDRNLRKELSGAFKDYQASRFPKENNYKLVDEEAISFNVSLMGDIYELAHDFFQKIETLQEEKEEK